MCKNILYVTLCCLTLTACGQNNPKSLNKLAAPTMSEKTQPINPEGANLATRFNTPSGYDRIQIDSISFANYLRYLPLKKDGALVTYFDGRSKPNRNVYDAVIDLPIGQRDLHQCADAVMRLRADYLFRNKKYDSIHFNFTNGFLADYGNWRKGKRIIVDGNEVSWKQKAPPSDTEKDFWNYLEMVFSYAGTASLSEELNSVAIAEMQIGDVFIKGGFPGHAVIIVDMAADQSTGAKVFLLAQSYMPAQELQLLKNPNNALLSPWYSISAIGGELRTPEWTFESGDLKRF